MIPTSKAFIEPLYNNLKATEAQVTTPDGNVQSIVFLGKSEVQELGRVIKRGLIKVTLDTITANMWRVGMKANLTGTSIVGAFEIVEVGSDYLVLIVPVLDNSVNQAGVAGTAVPYGILPTREYTAGTVAKNNEGKVVSESYTGNEIFLLRLSSENNAAKILQVVNTHASAGITVTIEESLDGVNWAALPTAISADAIAAGATKTYHLDYKYLDVHIKVTIAATNSEYHLMLR